MTVVPAEARFVPVGSSFNFGDTALRAGKRFAAGTSLLIFLALALLGVLAPEVAIVLEMDDDDSEQEDLF